MLWLNIDKNSKTPMLSQVYGQIEKRTLNGEIEEGIRRIRDVFLDH
ncbi:MAG: hypothetical protein N3I35_19410 [Clostridia bacterium]|nr:hypothetical protein [Clostridia bacterium]